MKRVIINVGIPIDLLHASTMKASPLANVHVILDDGKRFPYILIASYKEI